MNDNPQHLPAKTGNAYTDVIARAAQDPNFDIDKFERLLAMQQEQEQRQGDLAFNEALSAAQAEMGPISADAQNPQTRSRYATFARLDSAIRPIYTKHGFGVSFTTEPTGEPDSVRVVGMLTNGIIARRYQYDNPIETTGAKGSQYTTRTWARSSAVTYAKRNVLTMMFNLAVGDDDDGARGAVRRPPAPSSSRPQQQIAPEPAELINPVTGELITGPIEIDYGDSDDARSWAERFYRATNRLSQSIDDVDRWLELNKKHLDHIAQSKPEFHRALTGSITMIKERLVER